jgi:secreted trypsin-like serine protease
MFFTLISFIFVLITCSYGNRLNVTCGKSSQYKPKIIQGTDTSPYKWPWMASLRYNNSHHCGAFLIHEKYVLTAAHCLYRKNISLLQVAVGLHNLSDITSHDIYNVTQIYLNEKFRFTTFFYGYDIGLVLLESKVDLNDRVSLICLPSSQDDTNLISEMNAFTAGWGRTDTNGVYNYSNILQETIFTIDKDIIACRQVNVNLNLTYCALAFNTSSSTCNGDSGGPLFYQLNETWYAFGITSFGFQTSHICSTKLPNYFTKIPLFLDWIESKMTFIY